MELSLPPRQERKGCDRDIALMGAYPARAKRVYGWLSWPLTRQEIAGVRWFLETGDEAGLPAVFEKQEA